MAKKQYKEGPTERGWRLVDKYLEKMTKELGQKDMYYILWQYAQRRDSKYWQRIIWDPQDIKNAIRKYGKEDMCTQCMERAIKVIGIKE